MDLVYIGKIVNTHGIKGELRILSDFDKKDIIFKKGFTFYIGEARRKEIVASYRHHKCFEMVTFEGYDNINQVLKYLKMDVYVKKEDLNLNDDEYVLEELIGCNIIFSGKCYGKVSEIVYNNGNVLLSISGDKNFYIPNNSYFIKKVDLDKKEILTNDIEGLIL